MARKLPGLTRLQSSKVWPKEDGSPTPAYRLLDLYDWLERIVCNVCIRLN